MTSSDLEGVVDFELYFKDYAGNFVVVRQNNKITNNCHVPGNLAYHDNNTTDCVGDNLTWENFGLSTKAQEFIGNSTTKLFSQASDTTYYVDNETLQTKDKLFFVYDRTPPRAYLALVNPYHEDNTEAFLDIVK